MDSKRAPYSVPRPEYHMLPRRSSRGSDTTSFHTAPSRRSISDNGSIESSQSEEQSTLPQDSSFVNETSDEDTAEPPNYTPPLGPGWKLTEPYRSKMPKDSMAKENWVKAMKESDDGMCQGWRDQIDTLIIVAGLFSATVTAFTVESYQWLNETPAEMLARLQLRALLNTTRDPSEIDRLAPATFKVTSSLVLINTLWFVSLTLALAAVVVSLLCKQWLYEYQRYDNLTTEQAFLIRGLRYRGLQEWHVPEIIASLPIFLQTALVLFLVGLMVLLWPLQITTALFVTIIVGSILLFLGATSMLPTIQYFSPRYHTQCPYKSSQSWSIFRIFTSRLVNFRTLTSWAAVDWWEVTCISNGTGLTLSRVYGLLSNSVDAVQNIYSFLADTSLKPKIQADLTLLSEFVDGLDTFRKDEIVEAVKSYANIDESNTFQRIDQLKAYIYHYSGMPGPNTHTLPWDFKWSFDPHIEPQDIDQTYHLGVQMILYQFLTNDVHLPNPEIFNRYIEHRVRVIVHQSHRIEDRVRKMKRFLKKVFLVCCISQKHFKWDPDVASHLVELLSYLFKTDQTSHDGFVTAIYESILDSHRQHSRLHPSPFTVLNDIREWINRMPESDLLEKVGYVDEVLFWLVNEGNIFEPSSTPGLDKSPEKQCLRLFAQFILDFYKRGDVIQGQRKREETMHSTRVPEALVVLYEYLAQH